MTSNAGVKFKRLQKDRGTDAQAGLLSVNGHCIKTPVLWLGHNFSGPVDVWNERRMSVPGFLVNACEIIKRPIVNQTITDKGMHEYLGFKGPIMMDSGGFLFQKARRMNVRPRKIMELYRESKIDIGVTLDHPLDPSLSSSRNRRRWERTLRNTETMASTVNSCAFMPVVHGYSLRSLKAACRAIRRILGEPPMVGVGSLVPLVKASYLGNGFRYQRKNGEDGDHVRFIADALSLVRDEFPKSFLHVFGVGGTTTIMSIFALGVDSVDSVAWRLKAAFGAIQLPGTSDRFLSPRPKSPKARKTIQGIENDILARCRCPICSQYESLGWQKRRLDASFRARTIHNAWVFLREVQRFRKAVLNGKGYRFLEKGLSKMHRFYRFFHE